MKVATYNKKYISHKNNFKKKHISVAILSLTTTVLGLSPSISFGANECTTTGTIIDCTPSTTIYDNGITYTTGLNGNYTINFDGVSSGALEINQSQTGGPARSGIIFDNVGNTGDHTYNFGGTVNITVDDRGSSSVGTYGITLRTGGSLIVNAGIADGANINLKVYGQGPDSTPGLSAVRLAGQTIDADFSGMTAYIEGGNPEVFSIASGSGDLNLKTGDITVVGNSGNYPDHDSAIEAVNLTGKIDIDTTFGAINITGSVANAVGLNGIRATTSSTTENVTIRSGIINTAVNHSAGIYGGRNAAGGTGGSVNIETVAGTGINLIGDNALGIEADNANGTVNINTQSSVIASGNTSLGILGISRAGGMVVIGVGADASVQGGWMEDPTMSNQYTGMHATPLAAGVLLGAADNTSILNNAGQIGAGTDKAVVTLEGIVPGFINLATEINNSGTITGMVSLGTGSDEFNNFGLFELRNFADTTGTGTRDTKGVAISDFGGGNDTVINTGTVSLAPVSGETTTVATGEYTPVGALSMTNPGTVHGQLLNLNTFDNAGLIDLSGNGQPGDVLVITGGATAGTNGGGTYISNGGSLKLDTVLNEGGAASLSDILVVDNTAMGLGATRISVNNVLASPGGLTTGDGIKLVEVLGTTTPGTFSLASPVTYGAYEYILGNGVTPTTANNWYLRNTLVIDPVDPTIPAIPGTPLPNPNVGSYLSNQYIAGIIFNQNILDRRDNVRAPDQTLWVRYNHSKIDTDLLNGAMAADIKTNLIQIGADLYRDDNKNGIVAGIYGGYGNASQDSHSRLTGTKASGKVTGYHVGAYFSWMPEETENKGPYADLWGYYAWFDNKLTGMAQGYRTASYDSTGYAVSAEAGYSFELNKKEDGSAWILEPHAQITYTNIDADNFYDNAWTYYSNNKAAGIQTRLGARLYGQREQGNEQIVPFIEANWLYNGMDNKINLNNVTSVDTNIGRNVGELKLGVQGNLTERLSLWGHIGLQRGSNSYERTEFQIGLGWQW